MDTWRTHRRVSDESRYASRWTCWLRYAPSLSSMNGLSTGRWSGRFVSMWSGTKVRSSEVAVSESVRKTYQEKLRPTPAQERALEAVLWRCRVLYNAALEQRLTWWRRGQGTSATRFQQEAELKDLRAA